MNYKAKWKASILNGLRITSLIGSLVVEARLLPAKSPPRTAYFSLLGNKMHYKHIIF